MFKKNLFKISEENLKIIYVNKRIKNMYELTKDLFKNIMMGLISKC